MERIREMSKRQQNVHIYRVLQYWMHCNCKRIKQSVRRTGHHLVLILWFEPARMQPCSS